MSYKRHHKEIKVTDTQRIVLDFQGFILESDDGIFDTGSYRNHPFLIYSPFLESVFISVLDLQFRSGALHFPRVETILDNVTGVYDCHFRCLVYNPNQLEFEWVINDLTQSFEQIRDIQQENNEESIRNDLQNIRRDYHRRR
ncbi:MAG: hypothetical protein RIS64_2602 [Bacteroidota bacterium]|jgi:hypothetical protein